MQDTTSLGREHHFPADSAAAPGGSTPLAPGEPVVRYSDEVKRLTDEESRLKERYPEFGGPCGTEKLVRAAHDALRPPESRKAAAQLFEIRRRKRGLILRDPSCQDLFNEHPEIRERRTKDYAELCLLSRQVGKPAPAVLPPPGGADDAARQLCRYIARALSRRGPPADEDGDKPAPLASLRRTLARLAGKGHYGGRQQEELPL